MYKGQEFGRRCAERLVVGPEVVELVDGLDNQRVRGCRIVDVVDRGLLHDGCECCHTVSQFGPLGVEHGERCGIGLPTGIVNQLELDGRASVGEDVLVVVRRVPYTHLTLPPKSED